MALLVIVFCLLIDRFLVNKQALYHVHFFARYQRACESAFSESVARRHPWILLALTVLPVVLIIGIFLFVVNTLFFGLIELLFTIIIVYYCIDANNLFCCAESTSDVNNTDEYIAEYLTRVNNQLFAVLTWYIIMGPIGAVIYRLVSLCTNQASISREAFILLNLLDWIPARITALLYLLVGNFQAGFKQFCALLLTSPNQNNTILSTCGMAALNQGTTDGRTMLQANNLVQHAMLVLLVVLAFSTLIS